MPMKRALDICFSVPGLLVTMPAGLAIAVAVRATSPGPALFRQIRIGRGTVPFVCYKFRTMHDKTGDWPSHEVGHFAVTPIGRILRRWKLDELPQLYNVIRGDMSLVGPRPCLPTQHELIKQRRRHGAFDVRPGISGLAQVAGIDMSKPRLLARIDGLYVRKRSLGLDLRLMLATLTGAGIGVDRVNGRAGQPEAMP